MMYLLLFLSGFTGLVYQVLWMRQLGLLFGNTSHAAAATLAAFFSGLAVGSWFWGERVARARNALRTYAWLELGIAATAALYFGILPLYYWLWPWLYAHYAASPALIGVKFALALLLVFPPAFCMGGTIPAMGQHAIRTPDRFGTTAALLYGTNTIGAACGALMAGFSFPLWLGFRLSCLGAMAVTLAVAAIAWRRSAADGERTRRREGRARSAGRRRHADDDIAAPTDEAAPPPETGAATPSGQWAVLPLCFISGFGVLALEVLWTRMFAQVLENSVYTFAAILVMVLLCLGLGSLISSALARTALPPLTVLSGLTLTGGLAVAATPPIFMAVTDSMQIVVSKASWLSYVLLIMRTALLTIGLPALATGTVFPFLLKTHERHAVSAGRALGRLSAANTAGAILGSLLCGFVFLGAFGMWRTMQLLSLLYLIATVLAPAPWRGVGLAVRGVALAAAVLVATRFDPTALPVSSVDPMRHREEIVETWEGSDCTVAVVRDPYGLSIKINSHYGLGSTGAAPAEQMQADLPLMIYPRSRTIFFLGMGTGITAGSALHPKFEHVERIVACELVPEVVTAARKYITDVDGHDFTNGLFSDPRATVLVEDGRHYLMATRDRFDIVNSDLFVPFRSGAGSLYSRDHFESVRRRLTSGGVFVQWLPLYQLTEKEFGIIVRTMLEVFDQVTLWRSNFQPGDEVVALIGHPTDAPLPPPRADRTADPGNSAAAMPRDSTADRAAAIAGKGHRDIGNLQLPLDSETILFFYCGNLTQARALFKHYPINTDDRPLIEYLAPRSYRGGEEGIVPWFVGPRLAKLVDDMHLLAPPRDDPMLANRSDTDRLLPLAGAAYHWARLWAVMGDEFACLQAWERFKAAWTGTDPGPPPE